MRGIVIAVFAFIVVVAADLEGTRIQSRDNKRCAIIGKQVDRDGVISDREARRIARWECKRMGDVWVSARYYSA